MLHEENEVCISAKKDQLHISMFAKGILELLIGLEYTYRK